MVAGVCVCFFNSTSPTQINQTIFAWKTGLRLHLSTPLTIYCSLCFYTQPMTNQIIPFHSSSPTQFIFMQTKYLLIDLPRGKKIDKNMISHFIFMQTKYLLIDLPRGKKIDKNVLAMGFEPMRTYVQKILSLPP